MERFASAYSLSEGDDGMTCGIYCRLSREDREKTGESESIQNQCSLLTHYAAARGWEIYDIYCDEDWSGADARRPDFSRLLHDAELGRLDIVLCKTQSRFTRDMELVEKYIHGAFPRWGVRFVAVADHVDTAVAGNKKARQISGLVNEWYLEDLSENVRLVLNHKRSRGEYIGARPLYGYRRDPDCRHRLIPDPEAARVVAQIFRWRLEGQGSRAIAGMLNQAEIDSPAVYKQKQNGEIGNKNTKWNRISVSRILKNEMYIGNMVQGRRRRESYKSRRCVDVPVENWFRVEHTHQAIVDEADFRAVQTLIERQRRGGGYGAEHSPT